MHAARRTGRPRWRRAASACFLVLCLGTAGCATVEQSGGPLPGGASSSSSPSVAGPGDGAELARYGAPRAQWESEHEKAPGFGLSYLPLVGPGRPTYYAVDDSFPRVVWYSMNFPDGTDVAAARARVLEEFPPDARVVQHDTRSCVVLEVRSSTVQSVMGPGVVLVDLHTEGTGPFRAEDVSFAIFGEPVAESSDLVRHPLCA